MLFGGGQDKNGVFGWFFKRLEKSIEGRRRKHVDLVDDVDFMTAQLRSDAHLIDEIADVVNGIIRGGVELVDVDA